MLALQFDMTFADHPELAGLWEEYQDRSSPEADFVHQLDKLEMAIQALEYRDRADTSEFIESAKTVLSPELNALLQSLV